MNRARATSVPDFGPSRDVVRKLTASPLDVDRSLRLRLRSRQIGTQSSFSFRGLLLTAKRLNHEWTRILRFFCYSHWILGLCPTVYPLRYTIRVHSWSRNSVCSQPT